MSSFLGVARKKIEVKINSNCSYSGRWGTIIAVDVGGKTITDDTLTKVRLRGIKCETLLRVLCFTNKKEVKEILNLIIK
jgi:hypothetical protein